MDFHKTGGPWFLPKPGVPVQPLSVGSDSGHLPVPGGHYDLLVREDSRLALQGTVSKRLEDIMKPMLQHVPEQSISSPALRRMNLVQSHRISPMNFPVCPKGRGCPKVTKRHGAPIWTNQPEKKNLLLSRKKRSNFLMYQIA